MEIAVIRMLSDNVKYEILKLRAVMDPISDTKKMIPSGTYAGREFLSIAEGMVELNQFVVDDQVIKTNKLKGITEMIRDGPLFFIRGVTIFGTCRQFFSKE